MFEKSRLTTLNLSYSQATTLPSLDKLTALTTLKADGFPQTKLTGSTRG